MSASSSSASVGAARDIGLASASSTEYDLVLRGSSRTWWQSVLRRIPRPISGYSSWCLLSHVASSRSHSSYRTDFLCASPSDAFFRILHRLQVLAGGHRVLCGDPLLLSARWAEATVPGHYGASRLRYVVRRRRGLAPRQRCSVGAYRARPLEVSWP